MFMVAPLVSALQKSRKTLDGTKVIQKTPSFWYQLISVAQIALSLSSVHLCFDSLRLLGPLSLLAIFLASIFSEVVFHCLLPRVERVTGPGSSSWPYA